MRHYPTRPVRFLIYLAEEYQQIVEQAEESIYGTKQISLPTPQCVVFYNGEAEAPEEQILKLSDAFENKERQADVELTVRMLNINHGHNKALMEKCRTLSEYAQFVAVSRQYAAEGHASGLQEGRALAVLTILEQKGTVPADIKDRILSQNDEVILKQWLLAAASAEDIEVFREKSGIM